MNSIKLFVVSAVAVGLSFSGIVEGQTMRGESAETKVPHHTDVARQLELELIVDEMEAAGYEMDIVEGFDEEWEEEVWISSGQDEVESFEIALNDPEIIEELDLTDIDEVEEGWIETVEQEILEPSESVYEEMDYADAGLQEGLNLVVWVDAEEEEYQQLMADNRSSDYSFAEELVDPGWEEVMDQWELEQMEFEMEEDDIELMEAIFFAH